MIFCLRRCPCGFTRSEKYIITVCLRKGSSMKYCKRNSPIYSSVHQKSSYKFVLFLFSYIFQLLANSKCRTKNENFEFLVKSSVEINFFFFAEKYHYGLPPKVKHDEIKKKEIHQFIHRSTKKAVVNFHGFYSATFFNYSQILNIVTKNENFEFLVENSVEINFSFLLFSDSRTSGGSGVFASEKWTHAITRYSSICQLLVFGSHSTKNATVVEDLEKTNFWLALPAERKPINQNWILHFPI